MLISLVERYQDMGTPELVRYGAWGAALCRLETDCDDGKVPEIPDLEKYLDPVPESQRSEALCDLIAAHLRHSWILGQGGKLEDYVNGLQGLRLLAEIPGDLIEDEFLARYQRPHGDFPDIQDYEKQFPERPDALDLLHRRSLGGGRYIKLHRIDAGATGVVWEGFDRVNNLAIAIKIPLQEQDEFQSFLHEVEITSEFNHPGIVNMAQAGLNSGEPPFYVMRLAGTENLSDRIQKHHQDLMAWKRSARKRNDWADLLELVAKVCDAIEYSHAHGVLHCDLKPGNVICDEYGEIGVIDWGMARRIVAADNTNIETNRNPVGTPDYMPPEQADGIADLRSDVFGLGAILYEALTGRTPYSWIQNGIEARPDDWEDQVRAASFPKPRQAKRNIPKRLAKIVMKAMALEPDNRYRTASELGGALRDYMTPKSGVLRFWGR